MKDRNRIATIHLDFYNQKLFEKFEYLRDEYANTKGNHEAMRWIIGELYRRIKIDEENQKATREALRKGLLDIAPE